MEKLIELLDKFKIQILGAIIIILLVPIINITIGNIKKNYKVEKISKEKYFVLIQEDKAGVINEKGEILVEPKYYEVHIPNPSKPIFVCYYNYNEETGECKTKVVNDQGTELFSKYSGIDTITLNGIETTMPYEKNLLKYKQNYKYGLINLDGEVIVKPEYDEINGLSGKEGELLVKKDNKYGVINNKGVYLIREKFDYISGDEYFTAGNNRRYSGYIIGEKTSNGYRYGYVKSNQRTLLNTEYSEIIRIGGIKNENTDRNIYILAAKNGRWGLVKNGNKVIDFKFQDIDYSGVNDLFILAKGTSLGVYNLKGKKILDTKYDDLNVTETYIYTKKGEEEKYFDLKGKEIDKSQINESNENDLEGEEDKKTSADLVNPTIIPKEKDGKWGFIDKNSKLIVDYIYDEVTEVNKYGFAGIKKNGKWGSVDEKGNVVQEPKYKLDGLDEISFIGAYYKVVYDNKNIIYTDAENYSKSEIEGNISDIENVTEE